MKENIKIKSTKRNIKNKKISIVDNERIVREILSKRASGTILGLSLLIPEYLRLGIWDLLAGWSGSNLTLGPRIAMQMVNESALCINGIRPNRTISHQGFELLNGLGYIASDKTIHEILDKSTIEQSKQLQLALGKIRKQLGDYKSGVFIIDPHKIVTHSGCITPKKIVSHDSKPKKVLQTFFCIDAISGQPIGFIIGSSGRTVSNASDELIDILLEIIPEGGLLLADSEHSTVNILDRVNKESNLEAVVPAPKNKKIKGYYEKINYVESLGMWTGYSIGSTLYHLGEMQDDIKLIIQRIQQSKGIFNYKPFFSTESKTENEFKKIVTEIFRDRWSIEEFFNFESALGWNRASTLNLNIRYGKMTMGLIAQAAIYKLRQKLSKPYRTWTAKHLAQSLFFSTDGNIRVKNDTIIVTFYNFPKELGIQEYYQNTPKKLQEEGINPKIPWLYDFKIDFRFK